MRKFVVFILSHGRPKNVKTYKTLKKHGYSGDIVIVIDNEDETADEYKAAFKRVYQFDKLAVSKTFDTMDKQKDRRTIVYARNVCFDIAKELGYTHFIELDDDYTGFEHTGCSEAGIPWCKNDKLDKTFMLMCDFLDDTQVLTVAMLQGGDLIGGRDINKVRRFSKCRKVMNSFVCRTDRPFQFIGRINEDVNTYTRLGNIGKIFISTPYINLVQTVTQSSGGGMTGVYLDLGTYVKSFYTVMLAPSSVKIGVIRDANIRIHHHIDWDKTIPKILKEGVKHGKNKKSST